MRVLRNVCCVVLLAALGAAQQSGAGSPAASNAQDPSQKPASPLEEPKKPSEAEQNKPKAASFDIGTAAATAQDQDVGEVRLMTRYTELGGDPTRSFRIAGENNLAEFNWFMDRKFLVTRRVQLLSMYRGTDDFSLDPEHNSLQKAYARIYGPRDEYIFGDALVNFSRLTFNQNVKGVNANWKLGESWKLGTFGGVFIDRYGSLFKDLTGRPYLSTVWGMRLEHAFARGSSYGFNFSTADDQEGSLPPATLGTAPFPASNRVGSFDTKLQLAGVRLDGELAYSFTDFDKRSSASCTAPCDSRQPQPGLGYQGDWGARLDASWRYQKFSLRGSFVRYQPNFAALNARQIADLQDAMLRASYELTNWMTVDGTFRRSNNDLRGQLPFETRLLGPEAKLIFHDLPVYRRATFETGYRHRNVAASDGSINRYLRTPYAELTLPVKTTYFNLGYERRQAVDLKQADQSSNTDRVYIGLRGIYDLGGWHVNPTVRYELERSGQRPRLGQVIPNPILAFLLDRDSNRLGTAGLFIEPPKWFLLELAFRDASATLPTISPSGLTLVPSGYSRPSYRTALTYKFKNDENIQFIFSFERNNNFYFNTPNFDERVTGLTFVYKFGRRASQQ